MRIALQYPESSWNHRRFSSPWIALVTAWAVGEKAKLQWGQWLGQDGQPGELEIKAEAGDVVRWGQKDYRNPRHTTSHWGIVQEDGTVQEVTQGEARALSMFGEEA